MSRRTGPRRLRTGIVLTVVLAGIVPLTGWGVWVLREARSAGEAVLRARLVDSLEEVARQMSRNWTPVRSALADLADEPGVLQALSSREAPVDLGEGADGEGPLGGRLVRLTLHMPDGSVRGRWMRGPATPGRTLPPIRLPVRAPESELRGWMEVDLDADLLVPGPILVPTVSTLIFAVLDGEGRSTPLPPGLLPDALRQDRFVWSGEEWITERRPLGEPRLELVMAGAATPFTTPLDDARRRAALGGLMAVALGAVVALAVARRLSGSLERLAEAADRVSQGALGVRVDPEGPDEVARVGQAFNQMVESLRETTERAARQEALAGVGEFAASLAHEIRNPLTSARLDLERSAERLDAEATEGRLVHRALGELTRLEGSVSGALRLARSGQVERRPVDPAEVAGEALDMLRARFEEATAKVALENSRTGGPILADADALRRLLVNLLDNAADAVDPGGSARLRLSGDGTRVVFEIADDGCGMTPTEVDRATELLYTTRPGGTGLGLGIAQRIAVAHGGRLELESAPGRGTVARVVLPVVSPAEGNGP